MKKIYYISRKDEVDYDEFDAVVIIAKSKKKAKKYAFNDYNGNFTKENIICEFVGIANEKQIFGELVASFNAG